MDAPKVTFLHYIRAILFYAGFYPVAIIHATLSLIVSPVLNFRQRFAFVTLLNTFCMFWLRITCGLKLKVEGKENLPTEGAYVAVANHQSEWETFYLLNLIHPVCPVLKQELLKIPFFGWALALLKPIALDRSKRRGALKQLLLQGKERLSEGTPVLIYPQGTRVPVGKMGKFNKGGAMLALSGGVPIVPIIHDAGHYWPGKSFVKHPGTVMVHVGTPIETADRSVDDIHADVEVWLKAHMKELNIIEE